MEAVIKSDFETLSLDHYMTVMNPIDFGTWAFWLLIIGFLIMSWFFM